MEWRQKNVIAKVLVTGSSGFVGRLIIPYLQRYGFFIRGYDCQLDTLSNEFVSGKIEDTQSLKTALEGMDALIHLAAFADEGDFVSQILQPNVVGVYSLFEALKHSSVFYIVLASSTQAADVSSSVMDKIGAEVELPTGYYGLTKIWMEKAAEMAARLYGKNILAARLGWIIREQRELDEIERHKEWQKLFLSHFDAQTFFLRCLLSPLSGFNVINAVSKCEEYGAYDMAKTKTLIGFEPENQYPEGLIQQLMTHKRV